MEIEEPKKIKNLLEEKSKEGDIVKANHVQFTISKKQETLI